MGGTATEGLASGGMLIGSGAGELNPEKGEVLVGVGGSARMRPLWDDGARPTPSWDNPMMVAVRTVAVPKAATAKVDGEVAVGRGRTTISRNGLGRPTKARNCINRTLVRVTDPRRHIADIEPASCRQ